MFARPEIDFQRTPVTLILAALIVALAVVCQVDHDRFQHYYIDLRLGMSPEIWQGEIWRPFTTTLLHGDLLHALFNVYWLAVFGPFVENWLGSYKTLALIVLLALVSSLAQYVGEYYLYRVGWEAARAANIHFLENYLRQLMTAEPPGLVGLSGVNYGLFGLLWAGSWRRSEFGDVCNRDTVRLMTVWLIFCLITTWLGWMNVANLAHGVGLGMGVLIGQSIFDRRRRPWWIAATVVCCTVALATLLGAPGHPSYEQLRRQARLANGLDFTVDLPMRTRS